MKWLIILMIAAAPVIAFAEDEAVPAAEPSAAVEPQAEQVAQEPAREGSSTKQVETPDKDAPKQVNREESGVKFHSIDDLNKIGR